MITPLIQMLLALDATTLGVAFSGIAVIVGLVAVIYNHAQLKRTGTRPTKAVRLTNRMRELNKETLLPVVNRLKPRHVIEATAIVDPKRVRNGLLQLYAGEPGLKLHELTSRLGPGCYIIAGDPGAGKTVAAAELSTDMLAQGRVFVFLAAANSIQELSDLWSMYGTRFVSADFEGLLAAGSVAIILDGMNEMSFDKESALIGRMRTWLQKYPKIILIGTCRFTELSFITLPNCTLLYLKPFTELEIRGFLTNMAALNQGGASSPIQPEIIELCSNPLLLSMVAEVVAASPQSLTEIQNKTTLYVQFCKQLYDREATQLQFVLPLSLRDDALGTLAYEMGPSRTAIARSDPESVLIAYFTNKVARLGYTLTDFLRDCISRPPIISSLWNMQTDSDIAFLHQSFQEYFIAKKLISIFRDKENECIEKLTELGCESQKWWDVLVFAVGLIDNSLLLVRSLLQRASGPLVDQTVQRLYKLAARCAIERPELSIVAAEQVALSVLYDFKYGTISFNQELIEAVGLLQRRGLLRALPERLKTEIAYWTGKYGRTPTTIIVSDEEIGELARQFAATSADQQQLKIELLRQIAGHSSGYKLVAALTSYVDTAQGEVLEQLALTIGSFGQDASMATGKLIHRLEDPTLSSWGQANILLALGKIGSDQAFHALVSYLQGFQNAYRDTASWAIFGIVMRNAGDPHLRQRAVAVYRHQLGLETEQFTLANVVYCLGQLRVTECAPQIVTLAREHPSATVREDSIFALRFVGTSADADVAMGLIENADPLLQVVAWQTANALSVGSAPELTAGLENLRDRICADPLSFQSMRLREVMSRQEKQAT
jgi:hypothetical protein